MSSFKSIATHQTVSDEDFRKIMSVPAAEIDNHSNVKVMIVKDVCTLYDKMAKSMADLIIKNNREGKLTKMIIPVGPTPQYPILADICNREKICLKDVWIFFMDEYLDWESRAVPKSHPMSFAGYMDKNLFCLLDSSLRLNPEQVVWPNPYDLDYNDNKIKELGGIDICYGGIGYHGHVAFNEPYNTYYRRMTIEKFLNSRTRIIDLNSDTFVINSLCGIGGNCYGLPPKAVTIGMKSIMSAKRIELYCDGGDLNWQLATFRIACMHPPTLDRPVTLLQLHENPKETVFFIADELTASPVETCPK